METDIRKHCRQVMVVLQLVLLLVSSAFPSPASASPEWDHSKPQDGLFLIDFDEVSGQVTAIHIVKSTGSAKLDASTIGKLKRWKCKPGVYKHVYVPVTITSEHQH